MQRLIDANKLEYTCNSDECGMLTGCNHCQYHIVTEDEIDKAITVLSISENPTNGDMIRVLYGEPAKIGRTGVLYKFKYKNGKSMFSTYFDLDWWNSPYERR